MTSDAQARIAQLRIKYDHSGTSSGDDHDAVIELFALASSLAEELALMREKVTTEMGIADRSHERANRAEKEAHQLRLQALDVSIAIAQRDKAWLERDALKEELAREREGRADLSAMLTEHRATASELHACATVWEPGARLLGNITANALAALAFDVLRYAPAAVPAKEER